MPDEKFKCTVLKVFNEMETRRGKTRLQVIKWGNYKPSFEKREYWNDENDEKEPGKEKPGKLKGLSLEDLDLIEENIVEIRKLLGDNEK
jgi:hypothetical protein